MFRRATLSDVDIIRHLTEEAYSKWVPLIGRKPLPMAADHALAITDHIIDLLVVETTVVGLVEVVREPYFLLIESLAVLPSRQGEGFGHLLLTRAEDMAASLGLPEVQLYTNALFASNLTFYGKRGYQKFKEVPYPTGGAVIHMRKTLTGT